MSTVLVLNGPNLGRLGSREPDVYGSANLEQLRTMLTQAAPEEVTVDMRQTDDEAELERRDLALADANRHTVEADVGDVMLSARIRAAADLHFDRVDERIPVILNPAAFTHYSYALRDAAALVTKAGITLIEVHLSNPHARETFRHTSVVSAVATGVIAGFGFDSYRLALDFITRSP